MSSSFKSQQGAFIVNGQKGKYCVTLFPKETCQCVSTSTCYHILEAKMSVYCLRSCQVLTFQLDLMVFGFSNTQLPRLDKLLFLVELNQMEE
jgi:hypothetical protein